MRQRSNFDLHTWAQTVAIIISTVVAVFALQQSISAQNEQIASQKQFELQSMWATYLDRSFSFVSEKAKQGSDEKSNFATEYLFYTLLLNLENVHAASQGKIWDDRVNYQIQVMGTFLCDEPKWLNSYEKVVSDDFFSKLKRRVKACKSEGAK